VKRTRSLQIGAELVEFSGLKVELRAICLGQCFSWLDNVQRQRGFAQWRSQTRIGLGVQLDDFEAAQIGVEVERRSQLPYLRDGVIEYQSRSGGLCGAFLFLGHAIPSQKNRS
jgi:hypothetical protein